MSYDDPRLAAVYDIDNPDGPDHDFFRNLATHSGATRITDLGCGTGLLTVTLCGPSREVTGIDPSSAMLELARTRDGGDRVRWILGTSEQIAANSPDMVVMGGNVAMHILGAPWHTTLTDIARGLRSGGMLAFESRNPEARAWEQWQEDPSWRQKPVDALRECLVTDPPDEDGVVVIHITNEFDDGSVVNTKQRLQFRSHERIVEDLATAGLDVTATYRDWNGESFTGGADQPLMVFVVTRREGDRMTHLPVPTGGRRVEK
ncbi:class I SAM-dependent methyltransferase [Kocuria rhizophila]|uniref:class I SAM-dependent methyltransferase n=1 Tax=Kocuria rhizophila TaxID=72000 RepID=UPI0021A3F5C3|nr:class I SAM-dependent methyltransferase [Kocuria rhizophila]MCT1544943.1 class I SAM-dependent methyltransferase [Kocuria rhizophila]MCT2171148.1 class I SAM-dependent methyltransferase [Kocuria rhizophila]